MPQRQEGLRSVFRLLGSLAVVLIPFALYSYFYFDRQYDYHVNRNFRALTEVGSHLSALLRQFESLFDFDPYNEVEKTGYPIRAIVEERFDGKKEQPVVNKLLEALENVEPTEDTERERKVTEVAEDFKAVLKAVLGETEPEKERDKVIKAFRAVLRAALEEGEPEEEIAKVARAFRAVLRAALEEGEPKEEIARSSLKNRKSVAFAQDRQPPERLSGIYEIASEVTEDFEAVLKAVLGETEPEEEIAKVARAFRAVLRATLGETELEEERAKVIKTFRGVLKTALKKAETNRKILDFTAALKAALDKEKELDLLERSVQEESARAVVEQIAEVTKTDLSVALETALQFEENTRDYLVDALPVTVLTPVRTALDEARKKTNDAWDKVAKTQRDALIEFTSDKKVQEYKGKDERKVYLEVRNRIQSKILNEKTKLLKRNPAYESLDISLNEGNLCEQTDLRESISLRADTPKTQTSLSVLACPQKELSGLPWSFKAILPLADLMRSADSEANNFDLLVLAQEDGKVLYDSAEAYSAVVPKSVFAKFADLKLFFQEDKSEREGTDSDKENDQKARDDQVSIPRVPVIQEAEVAGTTYLLFLQPFQPSLSILPQQAEDPAVEHLSQTAGVQPIWHLGGVIRKSEFQKRFLALPITTTGLAMLILVLGILALPYIKLFFTNSGEPLGAIDIFFLIVSLVLGGGLITLLLLSTVAYHNMRDQFDETAKEVSKRIQENFGEELNETLRNLRKVPDKVRLKRKNDEDLELLADKYPPYESIF